MSALAESQPLFEEVQQPPWPVLALVAGTTGAAVLPALRPLGLLARLGVGALTVGATGLAFREFAFPMRTILFPDELHVRFGRRIRFRIPLKNVVRAFPRTYRPISEYGGWGIRFGRSGRAFNMSGNRGVQLVLKSGRRVLIGSQRPEELAAAIHRLTGCDTTPDVPA